MAPPAKCPDEKWFRRLAEGRLTSEQEQKLARHLEKCERCQQIVERGSDFSKYLPGDTLANQHDTSANADLNQRLDQIKMASPSRTIKAASGYLDVAPWLEPSDSTLGKITEFEFIEFVGRGGMGVVFRCLDTKLQREVAIKLMAPQLIVDPSSTERFLREARSAAKINHPNIVTVHAVDSIRGLPFLVMELIEGESLDNRLAKEKLSVDQIIDYASKLFQGLDAAHSQGVLHRDIKPANIMLDPSHGVKITDFGLACSQEGTKLTQTGLLVGTPEYLSPEQANQTGFDERSDLFSLGVVIYTMCSGESPFSGPSVVSTIDNVRTLSPRSLREINACIPEWFDAITTRLLSKNPDERFQSAKAVLQAIQDQHCPPVKPQINVKTKAKTTKPKSKVFWTQNRIAISLMAVTLVVSAITVIWLINFINNRDREKQSSRKDDQVQDFNVETNRQKPDEEDFDPDREERMEVTVQNFEQLVDAFDQNVSQLVISIDTPDQLVFTDCLHVEDKEVTIQSNGEDSATIQIELVDSAALIVNEGNLTLENIKIHCDRDGEPSEEIEGLIQCIHSHLHLNNVLVQSNDERPCIELSDSSGEIKNSRLAAPSSVIWWDGSEGGDELSIANSLLVSYHAIQLVTDQSADFDFSNVTIVAGSAIAIDEFIDHRIGNFNWNQSAVLTQNGLIEIEEMEDDGEFQLHERISFTGTGNQLPEILVVGNEKVSERLLEDSEDLIDMDLNSTINLNVENLNNMEQVFEDVLEGDFDSLEDALENLKLEGADFGSTGPRN